MKIIALLSWSYAFLLVLLLILRLSRGGLKLCAFNLGMFRRRREFTRSMIKNGVPAWMAKQIAEKTYRGIRLRDLLKTLRH